MFRRRQFFFIIALIFVGFIMSAPAAALQQTPGFGLPAKKQNLVKLKVFADTNQPKAGETFHLIFVFEIEKNWHLYWKNPGAGAAPIEITVSAPDRFAVKPTLFPRPEVFNTSTGDMYGYGEKVALFVPITPPLDWSSRAASLQYNITYAVCDDLKCVMERSNGSFSITSAGDEPDAEMIAGLSKQLPVQAEDTDDLQVELSESHLVVTGPAKGHTTGKLIPNTTPGVSMDDVEITVKDDQFRLTATISTKPGNFLGTKPVVAGLIALGKERDDPSFEFAIPVKE